MLNGGAKLNPESMSFQDHTYNKVVQSLLWHTETYREDSRMSLKGQDKFQETPESSPPFDALILIKEK